MIVLFTDFGLSGPYLGQVRLRLAETAPGVPVIDLFADAPASDPKAAAYLLAAYDDPFPAGTVFLCVVDPGVGSARLPVMLEADGRWYVAPGNGLTELVRRRAAASRLWEITWRPPALSASFHGRDLFAPVAGMLAAGHPPPGVERPGGLDLPGADWPDDLPQVVYVDHYGNVMTGLRAAALPADAGVAAVGRPLRRARTFSDVPRGSAFWYENANGLVEIAVNGGRADRALGLRIGAPVRVIRPE